MQNKCIAYSGVQVQFTLFCTQIRWRELWRILFKIHNKITNTPPQNSSNKNSNTISAPMHTFGMDCDDVSLLPAPFSACSHFYLLLTACPYPSCCSLCVPNSISSYSSGSHMGNVCGMKRHQVRAHAHTRIYIQRGIISQ